MNDADVTRFIEECKQGITVERLKRLLHYDATTGEFTRLIRTAHRTKVGDPAGSKATNGYLYIGLPGGRSCLAHRLAWLYTHGEMPKEIDHINGNRTDNRIGNLRSVTRSENNQNKRGPRSDSTTGFRGVVKDYRRGTYMATVGHKGKHYYFGAFATPEAAAEAATKGRQSLFTHCETDKRATV